MVDKLLAVPTFVGECAILVVQSFARMFRRPIEVAEAFSQMAFVGVTSVPIVALTTFSSGAVLALYSTELLVKYGATAFAGGTIGLAVTREIAPVIAGIMVAARCGSAMAANIGTMAVTEQIDALRSLSVNPINYLVIPRILAGVTMLPLLCIIGVYSGMLGGWLVSTAGGIPHASFMNSVKRFVVPWDVGGGMVKTAVFGLIIAVVACQQGLRASGGAVGVGKVTTTAVVISMVLIYVADYVLSMFIY